MFKQITSLQGDEIYLITSLWIFIIFFVIVGLMLFFMKKDYIQYMKDIPLNESTKEDSDHLTTKK
jgi:F420-0:gamma-glutamyl ligase-like protein